MPGIGRKFDNAGSLSVGDIYCFSILNSKIVSNPFGLKRIAGKVFVDKANAA